MVENGGIFNSRSGSMETAQSTKRLYRQDQALRLHGNFLPLALKLSEEKLLILNIPEKKKKKKAGSSKLKIQTLEVEKFVS